MTTQQTSEDEVTAALAVIELQKAQQLIVRQANEMRKLLVTKKQCIFRGGCPRPDCTDVCLGLLPNRDVTLNRKEKPIYRYQWQNACWYRRWPRGWEYGYGFQFDVEPL